MKDLDSWVANLYFEVEKVNLMDIKEDKKTRKLYYQPVAGMTAQEQQQRNKQEENDEVDDERIAERERKEMLFGDDGVGSPSNGMLLRNDTQGAGNLLMNDDGSVANGERMSARLSARSGAPDKEIESSSDDEVIDTSEMDSMNDSERVEQWAEEQAELVYNSKRT